MDEARAELLKIPPVTRSILVTSVVISLPVMMHLITGTWFVYAPVYVFGRLQVWRFVTSWLLGPPGIPYIFDLIMLHRASTELEEAVFGGHSADYAWHMIVSGVAIMLLNVPLQTLVFWRPLIMFVVYRAAKANPNGQVSLFGLVTIKNIYFPFVLLIFDLISGGPPALVQSLTGVLVSHAWFLLLPEPGLLRSAPTSSSSSAGVKSFGGSSTFTLSGGSGRPATVSGGATGWRKWAVAPWWVRWLVGGMHELPGGGSEGRSWGTAGVAPRGGKAAGGGGGGGYKWGSGQKLGSE